jgi:predicted N-formylglutamate amidohydrolase
MSKVIRDAFTDAGEPGDPLLGPDDPPAYQIVNPRGSANVVFLCDHASNAVPLALDNLGLTDEQLRQHIAWDIGAADVTRRLAAHFDAPAVLAGYSRLVIDCNRQLDDPESIMTQSDGHEIPGNRDISDAQAALRTEACFWPYHQASQAVIEGVEARGVVPALVMMHSFTPAMGHAPRPWQIGVLWDRDDRIAGPLLHHLRERGDLCVGDNEPYTAASPHGYSMPVHAARHGRANVQIELRQDLVGDEAGVAAWTRIMIDAFAPIFADPGIYRQGP